MIDVRFPRGAPPSETLYKILAVLFSEKEAALVALLPIKPFTIKKAAKVWGMPLAEAKEILGKLASRCILLDFEKGMASDQMRSIYLDKLINSNKS